MPSRRLSDLEPVTRKMVGLLIDKMKEAGYPIQVVCTYRTMAEQDYEYSKGRTTPGVPCSHNKKIYQVGTCPTNAHPLGLTVTRARAGQSPHNVRAAADFFFVKEKWTGPWEKLGAAARAVGLVWGGDWKSSKDRPHVERKDWKTLLPKEK